MLVPSTRVVAVGDAGVAAPLVLDVPAQLVITNAAATAPRTARMGATLRGQAWGMDATALCKLYG